ncbi:MAG TPA: hypothetical protein VK935_10765 [Actinomycetospora sp.]|nr:hypothetical protein [Actinomycetospora sp.]
MADIDVELDALEKSRAVVAGEVGRVPGLGDRLGSTPVPDVGGLDASPAVGDAISTVTRAVVADLAAAGRRLGEAERALDATIRLWQQTDGAGAAVLASAGG